MNKVVLMGRLTRDPDVRRRTQGDKESIVAIFSLAVQRRYKKEGEADADFINCVVFGKAAEFAEKYFRQGMKICISGHIRTSNYTNNDGVKVYTTDIIVEEQDFCESKEANDRYNNGSGAPAAGKVPEQGQPVGDGFMTIPDGFDEELPFA